MTAAHTASGLGSVAQAQAGREVTGMEARGPRPCAALVFGEARDPGVMLDLAERGEHEAARKEGRSPKYRRSGPLKANPMLVAYGPGPEGARCGTCVQFDVQGGVAGRYFKCRLRGITSGPGTDHRVRWPACGRYEAVQP